MKQAVSTFIFFILLTVTNALAEAPKVMIENVVTKVKAEVNKHEGAPTQELDNKLLQIIKPAFDFTEMSRRSLGANWRKASKEEQSEFSDLFSQLLAKNYLKQIRDNAKDSEFIITGSSEEGIRSLLQTQVKTPKETIKIDYRLFKKNENWKVYDVVVENIGLVSNYRSEFAGIVNKEGMKGLIAQLKKKLEA